MSSILLSLFIVGVGLIIICTIQIARIITDINDIKDRISGQADRLSQELFTDYGCITEQFRACLSKIDSAQKSISLEIACLAAKNNEDIKRMKGDFQQWDMIDFDGEQWIIHRIDRNVNGDTFYRVHNAKGQITNVSSKEMQNATFVKHAGSQFDE